MLITDYNSLIDELNKEKNEERISPEEWELKHLIYSMFNPRVNKRPTITKAKKKIEQIVRMFNSMAD